MPTRRPPSTDPADLVTAEKTKAILLPAVPISLHRQIAAAAKAADTSLTLYVVQLLVDHAATLPAVPPSEKE